MDRFTAAAGVLCFSLVASGAQGAVLFSFEETGGDVVGQFSGTLDLTDAVESPGNFVVGFPQINPAAASIFSGPDVFAPVDLYAVTAPTSFGTGDRTTTSAATGSPFTFSSITDVVGVPEGYVSGQALGGTITFVGATFASLGITPGSYVYSLPNDTITVRFGSVSAIPLPATLPLLIAGLALSGALLRRPA